MKLTHSKSYLVLAILIVGSIFSCNDENSSTAFDFVDPFIGTGGHGHTFPGATLPFGMVQLSPDTRLEGWDGCSGYHYSDSMIYGFSHTHLSGTGISDYGDVLLMPYTGKTYFNNGSDGEPGYRSLFRKDEEVAQAGYYKVKLEDDDIAVQLTAGKRVGFHQYDFNDGKDRKVLIDLIHRDEVLEGNLEILNDYEVAGFRHSTAWAKNQYLFFHMIFSEPIQSWDFDPVDSLKASLKFGEGDQLKVKVAISAVDEEGAKNNLFAELESWDFDSVRLLARHAWEEQLNKVVVEGGSVKQKRIFYTALYHTMIAPNLYHDADGRYRSTDLKIHNDSDFTNYTVFSLWDTYRSTHPLYTIIERDRTTDFIKTFLKQYEVGGRLPMWELAGNYTDCMIGYHAVPTIADAFVKGIDDFDAEKALYAMLHSAMQDRLGIGEYRAKDYIPSDLEPESVSKTLEYAYDDWTIARMADHLGKDSIATQFYRRAKNYKNVFDPSSGFMRARNNNRWFYPFDPSEVNFNYTEANSWQYSYYVPQDVETWIELLGGEALAEKKLDDIFSASSETSGRNQADITGLIGQYAHGNEPSHHIPYLYNFVGKPAKTQRLVRRIMDELYTDQPDGLSGNEDCGQMSSWLVMSAMGFYPVAPGSVDYILGSPWFEKVTINLENGKSFIVEAPGNSSENIFIGGANLNSKEYPFTYLKHDDILSGGLLRLKIQSNPSEFGSKAEHRPKSKIESEKLAIPAVLTGDHAFMESTEISLSTPDEDVEILYSFSTGMNPKIYSSPFTIDQTIDLYVWSEKGEKRSKKGMSSFYKIPEKRAIKLNSKYADHYSGGGEMGLIDFLRGGRDFRTGTWQGYEGVDIEAIVDMGDTDTYESVSIGFLQDENAWIFMPTEVRFFASTNGQDFFEIGVVFNDISYKRTGAVIKDFTLEKTCNARYVKIIAKNRGVCPPDHKGAGGKAWIFADEITVN